MEQTFVTEGSEKALCWKPRLHPLSQAAESFFGNCYIHLSNAHVLALHQVKSCFRMHALTFAVIYFITTHLASESSWRPLHWLKTLRKSFSCWLAFGTAQNDSSWKSLRFYFLHLSATNRWRWWKWKCRHPQHRIKHLSEFFVLSICYSCICGKHHAAEHWQRACSANLSPFSRKMDAVSMLSTGENTNILLTTAVATVLNSGGEMAKIEIWEVSLAGSWAMASFYHKH